MSSKAWWSPALLLLAPLAAFAQDSGEGPPPPADPDEAPAEEPATPEPIEPSPTDDAGEPPPPVEEAAAPVEEAAAPVEEAAAPVEEAAAPVEPMEPVPSRADRRAGPGSPPVLPGADFNLGRHREGGARTRSAPARGEVFPGAFHAPPAFHWRVPLPGEPLNSATHAEYSRPVVLERELLVGSAQGRGVYRMSRLDGTVLGVYPAAAAVQGEPLVVDGRVYFADTDGVTWAYTYEGDLLWSYAGASPILVRPTLYDGRIYVTNVDDLAVALDAETGALVWRYQARPDLTREAELRLYGAPPAIPLGDVVVLGFSDGSLVGVEADTGEERWSQRIGEGRYPDLIAPPVVFGEDLYASAYFEPFVSIDQETRTVRWRADDVGAAFGVAIDARDDRPDVVYHPGTDGVLRAYSALTGAERWAWDSGSDGALTAPVLTEAGVIVGTSDDRLYLVDKERGETLWVFHEPYRLVGMSASPVVAGRQLLFTTNAGYLYSMVVPAEGPRREELWRPVGW